MKTAIAIPCFGRTDCVHRCIASLMTNEELHTGRAFIVLAPDAVPPAEHAELQQLLNFHEAPSLLLPPASSRLYACQNILRSIDEAFKQDCTHVLRMDSDLIVSPFFIRLLHSASGFAEGAMTQSSIDYQGSYRQKLRDSDLLWRGARTGSNFLVSRAQWEQMSPVMQEYRERYLTFGPKARPPEARQWFQQQAHRLPAARQPGCARGEWGTGADSLIELAREICRIPQACTMVNRIIHASFIGECMTPESAAILGKAALDHIPDDAARKDFRWL